jgi:hypothetical protein
MVDPSARARDALRLIVRRGGMAPAWLAAPGRVDHVEVVEIAGGEVVFFWDLSPRDAARLTRAMREDLGRLEAGDFLAKWSGPLR